jgi:hypothetical protein
MGANCTRPNAENSNRKGSEDGKSKDKNFVSTIGEDPV